MIFTEIKQLIRKLIHNKTFTIINVLGLSIGLSCAIMAFLYIQNEFKFDKQYANTENTYRLTINNGRSQKFHVGQPTIFFDEILKDIPEIDAGCRLCYQGAILKIGENIFSEDRFLHVDSNFFNFYGWPLISGNEKEALTKPNSIIISESKSKELFGDKNPIGQSIKVDISDDYTITGVFKDLPRESHIQSDFLVSFSSIRENNSNNYYNWGWHGTNFYFKLGQKTNIESVNKKIVDIWNNKSQDRSCTGDFVKAILQPFSEIHLKSGYLYSTLDNMVYSYMFAIIAGLVLIISCFNFTNLYIAVSMKGSTETGIKKILGANKLIFARHIFIEILLFVLVALFFSFAVLIISLPVINEILNKKLTLSFNNNLSLTVFIFLLSLFILFIAGILPFLQKIYPNTSESLKGIRIFSYSSRQKKISQGNVRNFLVVVQFAIGIMLILSAIIINRQLNLIRKHDIGFSKEQVMVLDNWIGNIENNYKNLKIVLDNDPEIKSLSTGSNVPANGISNWGSATFTDNFNETSSYCGFIFAHDNYFKTIDAQLVSGRFFNEDDASENDKIVINESLMKTLNIKNPISTKLTGIWDLGEKEIVGVVEDIEYNSIHSKCDPMLFLYKPQNYSSLYRNIIIKLQSKNLNNTINQIKTEWSKITSDVPFNYYFLDEVFNSNYRTETQMAHLVNIITVLAVLLCSMGLFGLALFNINGRIKEIGVRKVNGAKTLELISLVNRDFIIWILLAYIIAIPISSFVLNKWLEKFAVKTTLPWWTILATGIIAMAIALLTISWQSWRAARRNPVESLRYE